MMIRRQFSTARQLSKTLRIGLLPCDGIGKEVTPAGRQVLEALPKEYGLDFEFVNLNAGFEHFEKTGDALPQSTIDTLKNECDGALFGSVSSPSHKVAGYSSPIVGLRKKLDLYANVRPIKTVGNTDRPTDMVIVRENTEDLYVKEEKTYDTPDGKVAEAIKRISEKASRRIGEMAYKIATQRRLALEADPSLSHHISSAPLVTITHKSNVLSQTDGLFRETVKNAYDSAKWPGIEIEEQIIDSLLYKMVLKPSYYQVIVASNLYGDLTSDLASAFASSLGVVPSANVGDKFVMGEPCHGSAPDLAPNIANPIAMIRSAAMMLEFMGHLEPAVRINKAVDANLSEGKVTTQDLGGNSSTTEVTADVIRRL